MISLENMEELRYSFCKQYLKMIKNSDFNNNKNGVYLDSDYLKNRKDQKFIKKENRRYGIMFILNQIKKLMGKRIFSEKEIKILSDIIIQHPEIIDQIFINKIILTKDIFIKIFSLGSFEDVIRVFRDFVSEKKFHLNYQNDSEDKNSCNKGKSRNNNTTNNGNNKPGDKPGFPDNSPPDNSVIFKSI